MSSITLTDKQNAAKNDAIAWFKGTETNGKDPHRIFTIAGYAGTGKSTMVSTMIEEMGLEWDEVAFVAYTGMAASVLLRKGNQSAMTIHRLIYDAVPVKDSFGAISHFVFNLKEELENKKIKLIVIDEFSMVDEKTINDILSFKVKTLALGDPGQLPPISGGNRMLSKPDVFLDEILRQALDNPIIYFSMLAREGKNIPYGVHGGKVQVVRRDELWEEMFTGADQIIAGKNATVKALNMYHRRENLKIESPFPIIGDKVICLRNDWTYTITEGGLEVYLVNGLLGKIKTIENQKRSMLYKMEFQPSFLEEEYFTNVYVDKLPFMNDKVRDSVDPKQLYIFRKEINDKYGIQEFQYGYAITCHKSQGSEFNNVLVFEEVLNRKLHRNWLYTSITRAKENLILVK